MNIIQLDERLERIESLLLAKKKVLTLEEACDYAGISRSYLYKLTSTGAIPHSKPNGKLISIVLFYGTFLASLINSLLMTVEGSNWKKSLVWTLISSVPLLFMIISFVAWYFEV